MLSALYRYKACGRWGLLMLVYAAAMWVAVVYRGEHWVVDVLAGLVCAIVAFLAVEGAARRWAARARTHITLTARVASPALPLKGARRTVDPHRASDRGAR